MAIFDSDDPSSTPKMVKKGPKWSKILFFTTPTWLPPQDKKIIKKVAGVIEIDLNNSALVLMGHI